MTSVVNTHPATSNLFPSLLPVASDLNVDQNVDIFGNIEAEAEERDEKYVINVMFRSCCQMKK